MPTTTAYEFGDIVLVPFPFTDQATTKKRPAVVISSEAYHRERADVILMAIVRPRASPACLPTSARRHLDSGLRWNDVGGYGISGPLDILALVDRLNAITELPEWSTDIDRNGGAAPQDIPRLVDLRRCAGAFEPWNGRSLP